MTAEDIARDLMVTGVQDAIESALVSAAEQGAALIQGKCDELVKRYDNAVADYKIAIEEGEYEVKAYEIYEDALMDLVHEFAAAVGSDEA
jgi:hypothetical protein